jgi:hypothetical protein
MENNRLIKLRWGLVGLVFALGGWLGLVSFPVRAMALETLTWQIDVIDSTGDVGFTPSLALEPGTEAPYISYYDNTLDDLKLAFPVTSGGDCGPANTWSCNSLAFQNTTDFGAYSSLDFNSVGQWGIAYSDFTLGHNAFRGIPAAGATDLFWSPIEPPTGNGFVVQNTLAYNQSNVGHVSYGFLDFNVGGTFIKHAEYVGLGGNCGGGVWQCDGIVETSGLGFAVYNTMFFINDLPFIVYRDINQHLAIAVRLGTGNCGANNDWECMVLDATTTVNGMIAAVSRAPDYVGIAYVGGDNTLRFAEVAESGGNCGSGLYENVFRCRTLDFVGAAASGQLLATSLGLWNDEPVIAYTDADDQGHSILKIAYPQPFGNCGPSGGLFLTWRCEVVDDGDGSNSVGYYPSLEVATDGALQIAYYDLTAGNLKFALSAAPVAPTPTPTATLTPTPPPGTLSTQVYLPLIAR